MSADAITSRIVFLYRTLGAVRRTTGTADCLFASSRQPTVVICVIALFADVCSLFLAL
jgi:hypothetical protein